MFKAIVEVAPASTAVVTGARYCGLFHGQEGAKVGGDGAKGEVEELVERARFYLTERSDATVVWEC